MRYFDREVGMNKNNFGIPAIVALCSLLSALCSLLSALCFLLSTDGIAGGIFNRNKADPNPSNLQQVNNRDLKPETPTLKDSTNEVLRKGNYSDLKKFHNEHRRKARAAQVGAALCAGVACLGVVAAPATGGSSIIPAAAGVYGTAELGRQADKHHQAADRVQKRIHQIDEKRKKPPEIHF